MVDRTCAVVENGEVCGRPILARDWCTTHYARWWRHGSTDRPRLSFEEAFWLLVDRRGPDDCWPWKGSRRARGYGSFRGKVAHRVAYELTVGPIPAGKQLDHYRCDNPPCCNPAHVRPATARENNLRSSSVSAVNARKTHCPRGHEYNETNTHYCRDGSRACRICRREATQAQRQALRRARGLKT